MEEVLGSGERGRRKIKMRRRRGSWDEEQGERSRWMKM